MVIRDFLGSVFHSVIVAETGSSNRNRLSRTPHKAARPQKLFVPLKTGQRPSGTAPLEYCSKIVRPFWITSSEMPRFDSEYLAARVQLLGLISAEADKTGVKKRIRAMGNRTTHL
jgi:hypothetical protein